MGLHPTAYNPLDADGASMKQIFRYVNQTSVLRRIRLGDLFGPDGFVPCVTEAPVPAARAGFEITGDRGGSPNWLIATHPPDRP